VAGFSAVGAIANGLREGVLQWRLSRAQPGAPINYARIAGQAGVGAAVGAVVGTAVQVNVAKDKTGNRSRNVWDMAKEQVVLRSGRGAGQGGEAPPGVDAVSVDSAASRAMPPPAVPKKRPSEAASAASAPGGAGLNSSAVAAQPVAPTAGGPPVGRAAVTVTPSPAGGVPDSLVIRAEVLQGRSPRAGVAPPPDRPIVAAVNGVSDSLAVKAAKYRTKGAATVGAPPQSPPSARINPPPGEPVLPKREVHVKGRPASQAFSSEVLSGKVFPGTRVPGTSTNSSVAGSTSGPGWGPDGQRLGHPDYGQVSSESGWVPPEFKRPLGWRPVGAPSATTSPPDAVGQGWRFPWKWPRSK